MTEQAKPKTPAEITKEYKEESALMGVRLQMKQVELIERLNKIQQYDLKLMCVIEDIVNTCLTLTARKCYLEGALSEREPKAESEVASNEAEAPKAKKVKKLKSVK